jgi:hypothetical protein
VEGGDQVSPPGGTRGSGWFGQIRGCGCARQTDPVRGGPVASCLAEPGGQGCARVAPPVEHVRRPLVDGVQAEGMEGAAPFSNSKRWRE